MAEVPEEKNQEEEGCGDSCTIDLSKVQRKAAGRGRTAVPP
jgi:hypothetical protein